MSVIDRRIVDMKFNNKDFESGAKETISTLQKLKESLNLQGAGKGLSELQKTTKNFSLETMGQQVDDVSSRFTNLGIIGMTALQELTKSAINMGKNLYNATIGQVISGGKRRAMNLEAAQFMFRGMGLSDEEIKEAEKNAIDAVMGTAYAYDAAANASSQLLASQVQLGEPLYQALRATAGVAAMTNSTFEDTARIFTTISGNGRLMGMQLTQLGMRGMNAAAVLAKHFGTTEADIREKTSKGLISFDMFSEAMFEAYGEHAAKADETFSGALANMKSALSRLGGDFWIPILQNAQKVLLPIRRMIDGVRQAITDWGVVSWFEKSANRAGVALESFFDRLDYRHLDSGRDDLVIFMYYLDDLAKIAKNTARVIGTFFKGVGVALSPLTDIFTGVVLVIGNALSVFAEFGESILDNTSIVGGFMKAMENIRDFLKPITSSILVFLMDASSAVEEFLKSLFPKKAEFNELLDGIPIVESRYKFKDFGEAVKQSFSHFKKIPFMEKITEAFYYLKEAVESVTQSIKGGLKGAFDWLTQGFKDLFKDMNQFDIVGAFTAIFGVVALGKITGSAGKITEAISGMFSGVKNTATGIGKALGGLGNLFKSWQDNINAKSLWEIAKSIALLAASITLISFIEPRKLQGSLEAITILFRELFGSLGIMTKVIGDQGFRNMSKATTAMVKLSIAILLLSYAVKKMAELEWDQLTKGLVGVAALAGILAGISAITSRNERAMAKGAAGLILFAAAVYVLTSAVKRLSSLEWEELGKGLIAVGVLMAGLAIFTKMMDLDKVGLLKGAGLILIATAIGMLAKTLTNLGQYDFETLGMGALALGVLLAEIAVFTRAIGSPKRMISLGVGLVLLATAVNMLSKTILKFSSLSWEELQRGMLGFAGVLGGVVIALRGMPKNVLSISTGLVIFGVALSSITKSILKMANVPTEDLVKALGAFAAMLVLLAGATRLAKSSIGSGVTFILMATAISMLTLSLFAFTKLKVSTIVKGMTTIGVALGVLIGAAYAATFVAPGMIALSVTLGVLSLSIVAFAAAITAITGAVVTLGALQAMTVIGVFVTIGKGIIAAIGEIIVGVAKLAPNITMIFADALAKVSIAIVQAIPNIVQAVIALSKGLLEIVREVGGDLIHTVLVLLDELLNEFVIILPSLIHSGKMIVVAFLEGIANAIPDVLEAGVNVIVALLEGIAKTLDRIVKAAFEVLISFIESFAEAVDENAVRIANAAWKLIFAIIKAILSFFHRIYETARELIGEFIRGLFSKEKDTETESKSLGLAVIKGILEGVGNLILFGGKLMLDLISGIGSKVKSAWEGAKTVGSNIRSGLSTGWGNLKTFASNAMDNVKAGINGMKNSIWSTASTIGSNMMYGMQAGINAAKQGLYNVAANTASTAMNIVKRTMDIRSPSRVMFGIGEFFTMGLATGILSRLSSVEDSSSVVAQEAISGVKTAIEMITDIIDDMDGEPTITPIIDLDDAYDDLDAFRKAVGDDSMFRTSRASARTASNYERSRNVEHEGIEDKGEDTTNYVFNQTNNSPKALSTLEIYRQTRNQIDMFKGLVKR